MGWVSVKLGPKKRKNTWEQRKKRVGWVPVKPGLKHYKQGTHEMQSMGDFDATIAPAGYRDTEITQEHAPQKNRGGSQLSGDQKTRERESTWEQRKNRVGWVPVRPGPKQKERAHVSRERRGCCGSQLSRDQNKKIESTWEQKKKGLGESQLSRDSKITNKGHMRCNRWVISMQR